MLKRDMSELIATAIFPADYRLDSPAVQGEIERLMKFSRLDLEASLSNAQKVHAQRQGVNNEI